MKIEYMLKIESISCGSYNKQNSLCFLPQAKVIFRQNLVWTTKRSVDKFGLSIVKIAVC